MSQHLGQSASRQLQRTVGCSHQWLPAPRVHGSAFLQSFLQNPSELGATLYQFTSGTIVRSSSVCPQGDWGSVHHSGNHSTYTPFLLDSQINCLYPSPSFRLCFQGTQAGNPATLYCKSNEAALSPCEDGPSVSAPWITISSPLWIPQAAIRYCFFGTLHSTGTLSFPKSSHMSPVREPRLC